MNILWFIVCLVQIIIAFIAWVIWHFIRKVVETNCRQVGSTCHCQTEKDEPWPGKSVEQRWIVGRAVKDYACVVATFASTVPTAVATASVSIRFVHDLAER